MPVVIMKEKRNAPWIQILNEPNKSSHRFRYGSEKRCGGYIKGEKSGVPTIMVHNMGSDAIITVSCVLAQEPHCPHPHGLIGRDCENGICTMRATDGNNIIKLNKVGIQCSKRQEIKDALKLREQTQVDPFETGFQFDISEISLNCVRLCFQVHLIDANRQLTKIVEPVVTQEIFNKKSYKSLEIHRLSRPSAHASGGDELFILCDAVDRNDVSVRFSATLTDGTEWEGFGHFTPLDVHEKYAVVCKTPVFPSNDSLDPVLAKVQLVQPSTKAAGPPKPFQFIPNEADIKGILAAKKRKLSSSVTLALPSSVSLTPFPGWTAEKQSEGGVKGLADIVGITASPNSSAVTFPSTMLLPSGHHLKTDHSVKNDVRCDLDCSSGFWGDASQLIESNFLEQLLSELPWEGVSC